MKHQMAKNLEFKGQFQALDGLYPKLSDLNATQHETVQQIDTYFHITHVKDSLQSERCEPRLKLREAHGWSEGWLIYYERPNQDGSRYSDYQFCEIADPGSLKGLLTLALGVKTIVKKQREVWMFKHTRIHLDRVTDLGHFVELETMFRGQTETEAIDEHQHVKAALHLDAVAPIAVSYSDLIMQKL